MRLAGITLTVVGGFAALCFVIYQAVLMAADPRYDPLNHTTMGKFGTLVILLIVGVVMLLSARKAKTTKTTRDLLRSVLPERYTPDD